MKSDCVQPLLNALADGELNAWTAARVRRHVNACAACRAQYEAIQALGVEARHWRSVAAPAGLQAYLAEVITQLSPSAEKSPMPASTLPFAPSRHRPAVRWQTLAGAGAFLVLLAAGMLFFPGSPGRPTPVFAQVQRAMGSVKNVNWTETLTVYGTQGQILQHSMRRKWVLTEPPKIATTFFPDPTFPKSTGAQELETKNQDLTHLNDANGDRYQIRSPRYDAAWSMSQKVSGEIGRLVYPPLQSLRPRRLFAQPSGPILPQKQERAELDGKAVWKLSTSSGGGSLPFPDDGLSKATITTIVTCTWWVDVKTLRVIRMEELSMTESGQPVILQTYADIHYDQKPPRGLFNENPPLGAKVYN